MHDLQNDWHHHHNIRSGIAVLFVFFFISFISPVVTLISFLYSKKKHCYIQRAGFNSQVMVYKVLKYAWKHKVPEHHRKSLEQIRGKFREHFVCQSSNKEMQSKIHVSLDIIGHSTGQRDSSGKCHSKEMYCCCMWPSQILICETSGNLTFFSSIYIIIVWKFSG